MTDERVDALLRSLDIPADPSPGFVLTSLASLRPRARAARVSDASRIGRLQRDVRLVMADLRRPSATRPVSVVVLLILLIVTAMATLLVAGAVSRLLPIDNGPLIVSIGGDLRVIDPISGSGRTIPLGGDHPVGVSRSPDGRLITYWMTRGSRSHLYVMGIDGQDRRELAADLGIGWKTETIDTWSSDSRFLATEATLDGESARIVVIDVATGVAEAVTPPGVAAHSPLWSPDDRWLAFTKETDRIRSLAVIRTDGSGLRTISGATVDVSGPDTWSPDGAWIYFDSGGAIYRADVAHGSSQPLVGNGLAVDEAYAPASSPDGTRIVFIVPRSDRQGWDLYIANSDGSGVDRLLEHATHDGWSADGRSVLAEWTPSDQPGGLAVVTPDGGEYRVVVSFDADCRSARHCADGVGWGQPRP